MYFHIWFVSCILYFFLLSDPADHGFGVQEVFFCKMQNLLDSLNFVFGSILIVFPTLPVGEGIQP